MAGTEVGAEAVGIDGDKATGWDDDDNDASGGEGTDAACFDVVWTESRSER